MATAGGELTIPGGTSSDHFNLLTFMISKSIGESSRRVYLNTYRLWRNFAERHGLDVLDLSYENILAFLQWSDIAYATRQSCKTHMLRMLDWLEEFDEGGEWYGKQRRQPQPTRLELGPGCAPAGGLGR